MKRRTRELTEKEKDLLQLIANGWKDSEIKAVLNIGASAIRHRLNAMMLKTATVNRPSLIYWACKNDIL